MSVRCKPDAFGGHVVTINELHKTYSVIVVGSAVSVTCEYEARPANWRCVQEFITVRREIRSGGPTFKRMEKQAREAVAAYVL